MIAAALLLSGLAHASSHSEAPGTARMPQTDATDFYMFKSPEDARKTVFILNVNPLQDPGSGPNFGMFDDDARYEIHVDNEGDGQQDITFRVTFDTTYQIPDTFMYNLGDINTRANLNIVQTYTVTRIVDGVSEVIARDLVVAPASVGEMSGSLDGYMPESTTPGPLTQAHVFRRQNGDYKFFAGPRQEGFFVDLGRTFDLLNVAHQDNTNTLLGYNVMSIAIEVPTKSLTRNGLAASAGNKNNVVASWTSISRQKTTVLNADGTTTGSGPWVQVSRLGNPLVNEAVIAIQDKDKFNASHPSGDLQFLTYVTDPILIQYMNALLGVPVPTEAACDAGLGIGGREDLVLAFLTGHPALGTMPVDYALGGPIPGENGKVFGAFEALRIDLEAPASSNSWPNGRKVGDDVVDVALSAEAGLLCTGGGSGLVPDGVTSAGLSYLTTFPFLGDPWAGTTHPRPPER